MLKKFLTVTMLAMALLCMFVIASFVKAWINNSKNNTHPPVSKVAASGVPVGFDVNVLTDTDIEVSPMDIFPEATILDGDEKLLIESTESVNTEKTMISKKPESIEQSNIDAYHARMTNFCTRELEPLGLTLSSDTYFNNGKQCILLYFSGGDSIDYENKKQAAVKLGSFVYTAFEEETGFQTDYLKVHFMLPEGESFALDRDCYHTWAQSGDSEDILFQSIPRYFSTPDSVLDASWGQNVVINHSDQIIMIQYPNPIESPIDPASVQTDIFPLKGRVDITGKFNPYSLQSYLREAIGDEFGFSVEGDGYRDVGIYIFIDKSRGEMEQSELEDLTVELCNLVLRNDTDENLLKVGAFKLIDSTIDTLYVFCREEMESLWPKDSSDEPLRAWIKNWK